MANADKRCPLAGVPCHDTDEGLGPPHLQWGLTRGQLRSGLCHRPLSRSSVHHRRILVGIGANSDPDPGSRMEYAL